MYRIGEKSEVTGSVLDKRKTQIHQVLTEQTWDNTRSCMETR